jgi:phosphoglycerol transferase MdoB-like AlkP superfamily enzyme
MQNLMMYLKQIGNLLYKLFILLIIYSISRLFFYFINLQAFGENSLSQLFKIFFFGTRFDFSVVIYYNLLFIFLYLLPFNFVHHKYFKRIWAILFYTGNFFLILFNFADCEYFKYTGKRSTADIFAYVFLSDDVAILVPQFLKDFWYLFLFFAGTVFGGIYVMNKTPFQNIERYHFNIRSGILASIFFILVIGVLFVGARGTGLKPIRIITASRYTNSQNIPLILNTPFTILMTVKDETVNPIVYFNQKDLARIYTPEHDSIVNKPRRYDNVMVIILESFSKEFIGALNDGKGYTPCFDSIIHKGLVFENAFANGKRSIEAVPAIFAGLPAFTDDAYISSRFAGNRLLTLPDILDQEGYHTSFFHGGRNGTMGFDEFCRIAGIQHYYGLNEYRGPEAFDGTWGIYDEEFLQYYAKMLNQLPKPFFSTVFTLSSHHPYRIPDKYKNRFRSAPNELTRSVRYSDYALGKFFQTISKDSWYKHTLFIFTADHTAKEQSRLYGTRVGIFRIPIVYFLPGDTAFHGVSSRITQQADIMPSVLDYLGINKPFLAFGSSIFSNKTDGYAANFLGGIYQYFHGNDMLMFNGEKNVGLYQFSSDKMLKNNLLKDSVNLASRMETKLKAMIQQYNYRMLNNKMVIGMDKN